MRGVTWTIGIRILSRFIEEVLRQEYAHGAPGGMGV